MMASLIRHMTRDLSLLLVHIVEVAALQAASAFAHEAVLRGSRIISCANFSKQKLYMRNWGMVLTSTTTIMVAAQVRSSVQADQFTGRCYARACALSMMADEDKARRVLEKVFNYNVLKNMDA